MELSTERLFLREYVPEDFEALRAIISDPETMKFYPRPYDDDGVRRWLSWNFDNYKSLGFGLWALVLKETGAFVGDCGITMQIIHKKIVPEIGYHIHKDYQGRGLATEAARFCKDWIFEHTPFKTVYSYMNAENKASAAVAQKNGMRLVDEYDDETEHLLVYAVTRAEWEASRDRV